MPDPVPIDYHYAPKPRGRWRRVAVILLASILLLWLAAYGTNVIRREWQAAAEKRANDRLVTSVREPRAAFQQ